MAFDPLYGQPQLPPKLRRRLTSAKALSCSIQPHNGSEPTLDPRLETAILAVRELGSKIRLHTGRTHAKRLRQMLPLVDWVGLEINATAATPSRR